MTYEEALAYAHEWTRVLVSETKEEHKEKVLMAHKLSIEALEMQIPKDRNHVEVLGKTPDGKVIDMGMDFCSVCESAIFPGSKYCRFCGNALKESEVE